MRNFQIDDYVQWEEKGTLKIGQITSIHQKSATIYVEDDFEDTVKAPLSKLTYLAPTKLDKNTYKALARLEPDALSLLKINVIGNLINVDGYTLTVEDFLVALQRIANKEVDETLTSHVGFLLHQALPKQTQQTNDDFFNEYAALDLIFSLAFFPWGLTPKEETIPVAIDAGKIFLENRDKPYLERKYPTPYKVEFVKALNTDSAMDTASDKAISLYRKFAEELATEKNPIGLNAVGYGCYGGNRAFECDWHRAKECITQLFESEYTTQDKPFLANTLGYIYYYGRCNNGIPEYEAAYKYFSFAAFNQVYEAQYKIADMFRNGYGVVKSVSTANDIIARLYDENLKYIRNGEFNCKFADIAFRMGKSIIDKENVDGYEYFDALEYFLQADFAIRMRIMETNYYGDANVRENIANALTQIRGELQLKPAKSIRLHSPSVLLYNELSEGKKLNLIIKKRKNQTYIMSFSPFQNAKENKKRKLFITIANLGICGLFPKLNLIYQPDTPIDESLLNRTLVIDEMTPFDFSYEGKSLLTSELDYSRPRYIFKSNTKRSKNYRFVSVSFGHSKTYDYLCDDKNITVGDKVIVNASGKETEVTVCNVFEKNESETSLPVKAYKSIIRKA